MQDGAEVGLGQIPLDGKELLHGSFAGVEVAVIGRPDDSLVADQADRGRQGPLVGIAADSALAGEIGARLDR